MTSRPGPTAPSRPRLPTDALLVAVTAVAVAGLLVVGAASGRPNWPVYLAVVVAGAAVVIPLHRRVGLSLPTRIGLVVFAVGHVAGGMVPVGDGVLYQWWLVEPVVRYDNLQHAFGFGIVGRATYECLRGRLGPAAHDRVVVWWVVVLGACAFGAANEVVEWVMTLTIAGHGRGRVRQHRPRPRREPRRRDRGRVVDRPSPRSGRRGYSRNDSRVNDDVTCMPTRS